MPSNSAHRRLDLRPPYLRIPTPVDLYFEYRDALPKRCFEVVGLVEDEIQMLLESLRRRFDQCEPGAYRFTIKNSKYR